MNKKAFAPLILLIAVGVFFSFKLIADKHVFNYTEGIEIEPFQAPDDQTLTKNQAILETISKVISDAHYSPKMLDDDFSKRVFRLYMEQSDYGKLFFIESDVNEFKAYEDKVDDEIKEGTTKLYDLVSSRFKVRLKEADSNYNEALNTAFTFNGNDEIELDGKKMEWCKTKEELKARWRTNMKYRTLSRFIELKEEQKAIAEKKVKLPTDTLKTDTRLESDARNSVRKNLANYFKRINKISDNDRFAGFMNCICHVVDPHTDFFPPKDKQRFDEEMAGAFVGIGAALIDKDGACKIERIIPGSPCWKDGRYEKMISL
ncbi:tail-specific protease [Filimonas sp.]|nr:tail-specific protease [Filimonas sp.]